MPVSLPDLLADLRAETDVLTALLTVATPANWEAPTPAEGWAVRDQVSHLAYFDEAAVQAATEPDRFRESAAELLALGAAFPDRIAERYRHLTPAELSAWLATARQNLLDTFTGLDPKARVPWYGPDMSAVSSITARLMETWAHGQDIADTLGVVRRPTHRLRHIAELGIRTFGFAFALNGLEVPNAPVRVELAAPDGGVWTWGPDDAADRVTGSALDFCLAVTQRRHRDDTDLVISGPVASEWMSIAQAFAGAPGPGRQPAGKEVAR
ncbi:TIGR03084 family metal-binding protein [Saccharopolyspora sp. NPDC002686]|uniref:TIGR03084 family metal-binding protein n=1 Tax=Saccharopolyspora sp. NPDC002686 TaxID=3154541 RepID=UPI003318DC0D